MNDVSLFNAISLIDESLIEETLGDKEKERKTFYNKRKAVIIAASSLAACLVIAVLMVTGIIVPIVGSIPAGRMARLSGMDEKTDGGTNAYLKVTVSSPEYLYVNPIPDDKYLTVYRFTKNRNQVPDKEDFIKYAEKMCSSICDILEIEPAEFESDLPYIGFEAAAYSGNYHIDCEMDKGLRRTWIYYPDNEEADGSCAVYFDQRLSDEENIERLTELGKKLSTAMGVDLPDVRVERCFDSGKNIVGASLIRVIFYDKSKAAGGEYSSYLGNDYIVFRFVNQYVRGLFESSEVIDHFTITLCHDSSYSCKAASKVRRISLSKAEELLYKGYVFGLHSCPICMSMQPEVDFHGYEYVSFEYYKGVPFYVFYKRLDDDVEGNQVYAKTSVPAIEVSGLDEYFENQKKDHRETVLQ